MNFSLWREIFVNFHRRFLCFVVDHIAQNKTPPKNKCLRLNYFNSEVLRREKMSKLEKRTLLFSFINCPKFGRSIQPTNKERCEQIHLTIGARTSSVASSARSVQWTAFFTLSLPYKALNVLGRIWRAISCERKNEDCLRSASGSSHVPDH